MRYCAFIDLSKSHFLLSSIISTLLIFEHLTQVETSLNSSYFYILQVGAIVFRWSGSLSTVEDQELVERMLDLIKVGSFCFLMFPVLGLSWYFYYEYIALGAKWSPDHVQQKFVQIACGLVHMVVTSQDVTYPSVHLCYW